MEYAPSSSLPWMPATWGRCTPASLTCHKNRQEKYMQILFIFCLKDCSLIWFLLHIQISWQFYIKKEVTLKTLWGLPNSSHKWHQQDMQCEVQWLKYDLFLVISAKSINVFWKHKIYTDFFPSLFDCFHTTAKCIIWIWIRNAHFELKIRKTVFWTVCTPNHIVMRNLKCAIQMMVRTIIWIAHFKLQKSRCDLAYTQSKIQ